MKQISLSILLVACMFVAIGQPTAAFARGGEDDTDRVEYRDDDWGEDDEDDDEDEDERDDENELEVEVDVFTDTTIVKVELTNGEEYTFTTAADTEAAVIDVVAEKFNLSESAVAAALEFEVEDRLSRSRDEFKTPRHSERDKDYVKPCRVDDENELEVEADVFTDITIVKVELTSGAQKVFTTEATTTRAIAEAVADRYDLGLTEVQAALIVEVEDRPSRAADLAVSYNPADCDDDRPGLGNNKSTSTLREAELRAQVAELERLLATLIRLFTERFGSL